MNGSGWMRAVGGLLLWSLVSPGCGSDAPRESGENVEPQPAAPECGVDRPCSGGQLCLSARCYPTCTSDEQCSNRERCVQSGGQRGACVGVGDAGTPVEPCAGTSCFGATPVCHPVSGACVACSAAEHCGGGAPVCDRGRGVCVAPAQELCAPCESASDCGAAPDAGGDALKCVALMQPFEQVCVRANCGSDEDCPQAFECLPSLRVCTPRRGSCTAYRAASEARDCRSDVDCSALDVGVGAPESGVCHQGRCAFGCVATPDCPGARVCTPPVCEGPARDAGAAR